MLNPDKCTKIKPKPKPTLIFKNCSRVCAYHCAQLSHTTQHRTVLIIFHLILQTIIIAQMLSTGGQENSNPPTLKGEGKGFPILDTERWARS